MVHMVWGVEKGTGPVHRVCNPGVVLETEDIAQKFQFRELNRLDLNIGCITTTWPGHCMW